MNLVITISRRFGTGASLIAQELSEKLGVPVYDKAYIEHELDGDSYATEAEVIKELAEHPCIILGRCASGRISRMYLTCMCARIRKIVLNVS